MSTIDYTKSLGVEPQSLRTEILSMLGKGDSPDPGDLVRAVRTVVYEGDAWLELPTATMPAGVEVVDPLGLMGGKDKFPVIGDRP
jgi:hypothetical protein